MKPKLRPFLFGLLGLAVLTPLGLLASGTAWGEWGADEIEKLVGHAPAGLVRLSSLWKALLPDYAIPGWEGSARSALGYIVSALLGIGLVAGITLVVFKLVIRTEKPAA